MAMAGRQQGLRSTGDAEPEPEQPPPPQLAPNEQAQASQLGCVARLWLDKAVANRARQQPPSCSQLGAEARTSRAGILNDGRCAQPQAITDIGSLRQLTAMFLCCMQRPRLEA
jgi:hypothetical protein